MSTPKSIFGTLAAAFLPIMLFSFGLLYSVYQILGSPTSLKEAVSESGLYDSVISEALKDAAANAGSSTTSSLPVDDPGVQRAIEQAISPDYLEQKGEGAIDGLYGWLQGDTNTLQFNLDLEDGKAKLADSLGSYTQQYLANLPVCTNASDQTAITNPLNATCVPANFDAAAAAQTVESEILNNQDFLPNSNLNAQDLADGQGKTLDQQLSAIPSVYEQVKWGAIITGTTAVVLAVAVLLLSGGIRTGVRRLGFVALPVGLVTAVLAWGLGFAIQQLADALAGDKGSSSVQAKILDIVTLLTEDVRIWWLYYGLVIAGAGVVALIISKVLKRSDSAAQLQSPAPTPTPGTTPPNAVTNDEARRATEVPAGVVQGAPERPGRNNRRVQ